MKRVAALLLLVLFLLLGVQRTPEAMDPSPIIGGVIIPAAGCAHRAAMRQQEPPSVPTTPTPQAPAAES